MFCAEMLTEVQRSSGLSGPVDYYCTVIEDELFNAKPITLVEKPPGSCEPAELCHLPGCPVLQHLEDLH